MKIESIDSMKLPGLKGSKPRSVAEMLKKMKKSSPAQKRPSWQRAKAKRRTTADLKGDMTAQILDWDNKVPLGSMCDNHLALSLGCNATTVQNRRRDREIPAFDKALHARGFLKILGLACDSHIAKSYGVTKGYIQKCRRERDIEAYHRDCHIDPDKAAARNIDLQLKEDDPRLNPWFGLNGEHSSEIDEGTSLVPSTERATAKEPEEEPERQLTRRRWVPPPPEHDLPVEDLLPSPEESLPVLILNESLVQNSSEDDGPAGTWISGVPTAPGVFLVCGLIGPRPSTVLHIYQGDFATLQVDTRVAQHVPLPVILKQNPQMQYYSLPIRLPGA